jgi:hypothetical protein
VWKRSGFELSVEDRDAFTHPDEAVTVAVCGSWLQHATLVGDLEHDVVRPVADDHVRARAAGVLADVRQRLLHDAVGGEVDAGRQRPPLALDGEVDVQAGRADLLDQRIEAREARLRREQVLGLSLAQDAEQEAQLAERLAARSLDQRERLLGLGTLAGERTARSPTPNA